MFNKSMPIGVMWIVSALILSACSKPTPSEEPVRSVKLMTVAQDNIRTGAEFAGEVRARVESRLGFRVGGKLLRRQAEVGQRVKAGEVLAQLDPQDYRLAADAGKAQVAAALTNRDLAAADFKRYKDLREQNFISSAELERRESTLKAAQAQLEQAQAQSSSQGNQTLYTTLVADVAGVVTAVEAEVGQVVAAGAPVLRIAQDGPRDVVFAVPEDHVMQMKIGSAVDVQLWGAPNVLKGTVREVAASADPATRTFGIKVAVDTKEVLPLGATASVVPQALQRSAISAIKLPTSALLQEGTGTAVWVLESTSMTVRKQLVQIAMMDGNEAVLAQGLQPGMRVVVAGVHVLTPGQKVTVFQDRAPNAAAVSPASAAAAK